jgi:cobalt-zinc-cadmium efflux system membrane fusion protein
MAAGAITIALVVLYVLWPPSRAETAPNNGSHSAPQAEAVQLVSPGIIHIAPDSPLHRQLQVVAIEEQTVSFPLVKVSGYVIARIQSGTGNLIDRWQFSSNELSNTYADWVRVQNELEFAQRQLTKVRELAEAETSFLQGNVDRLKPLMQSGSVSEKDYRQARADLVKGQLESDKSIFAAESALLAAGRTKASLERHLSQDGIEPAVFGRAVENMVLVVANVPETKVALIKEEQPCEARFYGYADRVFPGHVEVLNSLLTEDRRMLRVLFDLNDPDGILKPGMFAEVGLGTDERRALMVSDHALLHVMQSDYVLVQTSESELRIVQVKVAGSNEGMYEVTSGLKAGDRVVVQGAILLKPLVVQSASDRL